MTHDSRSKPNGETVMQHGRSRRSEAGDTLIEVLLAVLVLGIASTAILLAFSTSIFGSSEDKGLATTDTVLRTAALRK